ncbi:TPA: signal transduction histidine-protein kinase/phosphatase UhpB [Vibrio vulnificus]|uniref:signal transduction histidine-protein kinase/phosphatase UhpB n=1 Tax=Vibrio vulnificus TaxID=672 RepID=UPI001029DD5C|nr:signal transduction histidine-protein kinase/phosphatase UhpB [Vibrio vulnificus]EGQ8173264.1 signal transduction histidine-protein kinase/phosphatase UhpB [Vibrio vulnificus]ELA3109848.1 signal transduction histidine-protein kinase/phosphatase UhpB [Vibrio vulnificus]ELB7527427.1 signal transduction histidine-protein kinase/phosphatase UhpB [Vibrio vulnificus]ELH3007550.1 signal transduction histidine-protein kinase/phosphatase UhpB [Vibrio vulnificus]ELU0082147.1 signal transduction histi
MRSYTITSLCGFFMTACAWFCLWVIAYYFVNDAELAILLFPFALRLGITLHTHTRFWPTIYLAEWGLTIALALLLDQPQWLMVLVASVLSIPVVCLAKKYYRGDHNQHLAIMAVIIVITASINVLAVGFHVQSVYMVWLASVTGGLMLLPMCYLLWNYLFQSPWSPLTSNLLANTVEFKVRHIVLYTVLLITSILIQTSLPDELKRFAPFCMAIPIIVLALRYGWQGALLATMLNSVALIAARSGVSNLEITDLLLSLSAQTLTGIMLGLAVQKQKDLNQQLRGELSRNQTLSRQLIQAEESVRRDVARELHDEIGQNITAIRTQASIIKRIDNLEMNIRCADTIEQLSLNVYDTTKRLLSKLRPKMLDDLDLKESVEQLTRELEFDNHGTRVQLDWQGDYHSLSDTLKVTLFRLCQEALNNAAKYAEATSIVIELSIRDELSLNIADNGIGFKTEECMKGMGIRGMQERVQALGGKMYIYSLNDQVTGAQIAITLPKV